MTPLALFIGFACGLVIGLKERNRLRMKLRSREMVGEWRGALLAKKEESLCECGHGSPMALSVEPVDDPAEAWKEDYGGESS